MRNISRILMGVGLVLLLAAFAAACNWPSIGGGAGAGADATPAPTNTDGAETILIPGGTFWMGSDETDADAGDDELPRHEVTLAAFNIYTHEVTNGMYADCVAAGGCIPVIPLESGPQSHYGDPAYAEYPVVGVNWNMARDYCAWAGSRLPTEAEWELAARGTDSLRYPWGAGDPACDLTNMLGCLVPPDTLAVGSLAAGNSPFGLWDMSGNVWEWVHDWYDEDYYTLSPANDPIGPYYGELKVVRGGGLNSEPFQMRGAARVGANPYRSYKDVGFRCVAAGETLPEAYTPTRDRHEVVPPDPLDPGGEPVEDPDEDPWYSIGFSAASCPDPEGRMHIVIEADSSEEVEYEVTVDGIPFDCYYDEMLRMLHCEGPVPETTEYPDEYHVQVHFLPRGGIGHLYPDKPTDCDSFAPERFSMALECPVDGMFTITFYYDPPITWDIVRINDVDIPCVAVSDAELRCTAPDLRVGDHYEFYLHGTDASGAEYEWMPWAPVMEDCPVGVRFLVADPFCFEDHPTVQVMYGEGWPPLESVSADGVALDCIGMAPGVQICGNLAEPAGTEVDIAICFEGLECSHRTIAVPACPGGGLEPGFVIEPMCYPPEAPAPAASIHYWPFDLALAAANANGFGLTCEDWGGGWYMCPGVPGTAGAETTITFCLADGMCLSEPMIIPDCAGAAAGGWRMSAIGCHDELHTYFMIDTGLAWLVPGVEVTFTASDGETAYTCAIHPTVAGRVYCAGLRPDSPDALTFCLQRAGDPAPTCQTYPDYPIWVAGIPPCASAPPPDDPGVPPVDPCSVYTDANSCWAHKDSCQWIYTEPQHCESIP
ncbi:MAG: hypothetical protein FD146_876 [Anaerolineaceae bacterium]|nr:MAG: hypothetical protein FD146_876 [Anaerolineaceae bacterium]